MWRKILRLAMLAQDDTEIREHSGKRYPLSVTSLRTGASSPVGGALDAAQTLPHLQNPAHGQFVTAMGGRLPMAPNCWCGPRLSPPAILKSPPSYSDSPGPILFGPGRPIDLKMSRIPNNPSRHNHKNYPHDGCHGDFKILRLAALDSSPQGEPWMRRFAGERYRAVSWRISGTRCEKGSSTLLGAFFAYFLGEARK